MASGGTGWYDYGFRDYDSRTGRFTTVDPIRDGMNWYAYCGGEPINCIDLWGWLAYGPEAQASDSKKMIDHIINVWKNGESTLITQYYRSIQKKLV